MKFLYSIAIILMTSFACQAQIPNDIDVELVGSVSNNVGVRHAGDGSGRLFVINQDGIIRIFDAQDNLLPTPFLNISNKVRCCGERGLLGLAFHPDYQNNGYFYVSYSQESPNLGDSIIERYQVSAGDPNVADPGSGVILMRVIQDFGNHNGGNILFGPDGYLYIGMGDGGSGGDPNDRGLNFGSVLGSMMRIDVDSNNAPKHPAPVDPEDHVCPQDGNNYAIPATNPFVGTAGACPEIWAYGLRNPWRWSFDKETGDMFIGDVGQNAYEEISFQPANSPGGENYGWNCREGFHAYAGCQDSPSFTPPILEKDHSSSRCSITGGYRYRGPVNSIQGTYFYADYCSGQVWLAKSNDNSNWTEDEWTTVNIGFGITSFGEDEAGNVYIAKQNGDFFRITGDIIDTDLIFADGFETTAP